MATKEPSDYSTEASSPVDRALNRLRQIAGGAPLSDEKPATLEAVSSVAALRDALSEAERSLRLRSAVEHTAAKSNESMEALRHAVCAFTVALRDQGHTPEAVLIRLKQAIQSETLAPFWRVTGRNGPLLHDTITTWCIKDYFGKEKCIE